MKYFADESVPGRIVGWNKQVGAGYVRYEEMPLILVNFKQ